MGAILSLVFGRRGHWLEQQWARLTRALVRIMRRRRLWAASGTHLQRYKALKPRSQRPEDMDRTEDDEGWEGYGLLHIQ